MLFHSPLLSLEPYPKASLPDYLRPVAGRCPEKAAFITLAGRQRTFGETWPAVEGLACFLQREGIGKGDIVGILSHNCPEYFIAVQAVLLAGGTVTPLNPALRELEIVSQVESSGAVAMIVSASLRQSVEQLQLASLRRVITVEDVWEIAAECGEGPEQVPIDPVGDLAVLPYSSGTTGLPKGVMVTHFNIVANVRQFAATGVIDGNSVFLNFLPYFHQFGLTGLMTTAYALGATQVVMPRFDPEECLEAVQRHRADTLFMVPPALLAFVNVSKPSRFQMPWLTHVFCGAAPLPLELPRAARAVWGWSVAQVYGLTEATCMVTVTNPRHNKEGAVGPPVPDTVHKVVDVDDGRELDSGELGELLVRGPQVTRGYWKSAEPLIDEDGWLRTGDIVRLDSESYMYVVDRKKEMIKYKGYQVTPAELESILAQHPKVLDAAVVPAFRDEEATEVPVGCVLLRPGQVADAEEIMAFVADRVAPYKRLRAVEFVSDIPRTASGKILRRQLLQEVLGRAGRQEKV